MATKYNNGQGEPGRKSKWERPVLIIFMREEGGQERVLSACKVGPDPSIDVLGEYSGCEGAPGEYGNCYGCLEIGFS